MENNKTITYAKERLGGLGEAIEKLSQNLAAVLDNFTDKNPESLSSPELSEESDAALKQPENVKQPIQSGTMAMLSPELRGTPAENTRLFKMPSDGLETTGSGISRDATRGVSTSGAISPGREQAPAATKRFIPFAGAQQNADINDEQSKWQETASGIKYPETVSGRVGDKPTLRIGYPQEPKEQQSMKDLFSDIDSFTRNGQDFEELLKKIDATVGKNGEGANLYAQQQETASLQNTEVDPMAGSDFQEPATSSKSYIEPAIGSTDNSGETITNFYFNFSDSLVGDLQSNFNSSDSYTETTDNSISPMAMSLHAILQRVVDEVV